MGKEIERKFLVRNNRYLEMSVASHSISQAYLSTSPDVTVRVRVKDDRSFMTVKGRNLGASRYEWEFEIPASEGREMIARLPLGGVINKTRHIVPYQGHTWEVDCFHGLLDGLVVAEIELDSEDEEFSLPPFAGKEVTGDARYYNSSLAEALTPPAE